MRAIAATLALQAELLLGACAGTARSGYLASGGRLVNEEECARGWFP